MKLLAIDQAYNHAGFAFFENDEYVEHGSYVVQKDADKNAKYGEFIDAIEGLIDELKPDCVITEMPWCGPNKKVYSLISELVGIIRCYCHLKDIEFEVVPIATYRSKLNIKNKKIAATEFIAKSFPELTFKNDDESDAIALGLGYLIMLEERNNDNL